MQTKPFLTLTDVNNILDAAQREAEANDWAVTIAVADDGGHLLGLRRLDGAAPMTPAIASEKARTAALSRRKTEAFEDIINGGRNAFLSAPLDGLMTGGLPMVVNNQVAGSIGVSGVKPDQDVRIAEAGIAGID